MTGLSEAQQAFMLLVAVDDLCTTRDRLNQYLPYNSTSSRMSAKRKHNIKIKFPSFSYSNYFLGKWKLFHPPLSCGRSRTYVILHSSKGKTRISLAAYTEKVSNIHISKNICLIHRIHVYFQSCSLEHGRWARRRNPKVLHCSCLNQSKNCLISEYLSLSLTHSLTPVHVFCECYRLMTFTCCVLFLFLALSIHFKKTVGEREGRGRSLRRTLCRERERVKI
jgi:hypothetical protein